MESNMETITLQGLGFQGDYPVGLCWDHIGIIEKKMETTRSC